jgi:hypothetical protein
MVTCFFEHGVWPRFSDGKFITCAGSWFFPEGMAGITIVIVIFK